MTDPTPDTEDAKEALQHGEKPDLGHTPDALNEALNGTDAGSDTRAGSLQGGAASGSDDDTDQAAVNQSLADQGRERAQADPQSPSNVDPEAIENTGSAGGDPAEGKREGEAGGEADAATG